MTMEVGSMHVDESFEQKQNLLLSKSPVALQIDMKADDLSRQLVISRKKKSPGLS